MEDEKMKSLALFGGNEYAPRSCLPHLPRYGTGGYACPGLTV